MDHGNVGVEGGHVKDVGFVKRISEGSSSVVAGAPVCRRQVTGGQL